MPMSASGAREQVMRLVDRAAERSTLDAFLDAVLSGESRPLVLLGEPGIGKTALLEYLAPSRTAPRARS
jgi:MoxR-like ATPase